jgi:hypothetical protein
MTTHPTIPAFSKALSSPTILAFSGKIGTGKNYLAENPVFNYLRALNKNVLIIAFADYLKMVCHVKDRILYERLFYDKDEESRRTLQTRGMLERKENDNIFIEIVDCKIRLAFDRKIDVIIISDLRFKNEFTFLKDKGAILFRINSPKRNKNKLLKECDNNENKASIISSHISEIDLDDVKEFHHYLSNDYENQDNIVKELNVILDKYYL